METIATYFRLGRVGLRLNFQFREPEIHQSPLYLSNKDLKQIQNLKQTFQILRAKSCDIRTKNVVFEFDSHT